MATQQCDYEIKLPVSRYLWDIYVQEYDWLCNFRTPVLFCLLVVGMLQGHGEYAISNNMNESK